MKKLLISFLFLAVFILINSQQASAQKLGPNDTIRVYAFVTAQGDTIPGGYLPTVTVYAKMNAKLVKYWKEWTRLRNAVYVTYPYAKAAGKTINEINRKLAGITDKEQRKAIIHSKEKELKQEFGDKITNLSVYQGKVLMKLIRRETGDNCYEIIKEYKGGFNAGFWQSVAFIFGSSLKQNYDDKGEDKVMEDIVKDVEKMYGYRS